ncbi:tyrosine protein kinase [Pelomyxa schiedti]|nr:tyrosine protein kinase [Pelomyxa schiedti]
MDRRDRDRDRARDREADRNRDRDRDRERERERDREREQKNKTKDSHDDSRMADKGMQATNQSGNRHREDENTTGGRDWRPESDSQQRQQRPKDRDWKRDSDRHNESNRTRERDGDVDTSNFPRGGSSREPYSSGGSFPSNYNSKQERHFPENEPHSANFPPSQHFQLYSQSGHSQPKTPFNPDIHTSINTSTEILSGPLQSQRATDGIPSTQNAPSQSESGNNMALRQHTDSLKQPPVSLNYVLPPAPPIEDFSEGNAMDEDEAREKQSSAIPNSYNQAEVKGLVPSGIPSTLWPGLQDSHQQQRTAVVPVVMGSSFLQEGKQANSASLTSTSGSKAQSSTTRDGSLTEYSYISSANLASTNKLVTTSSNTYPAPTVALQSGPMQGVQSQVFSNTQAETQKVLPDSRYTPHSHAQYPVSTMGMNMSIPHSDTTLGPSSNNGDMPSNKNNDKPSDLTCTHSEVSDINPIGSNPNLGNTSVKGQDYRFPENTGVEQSNHSRSWDNKADSSKPGNWAEERIPSQASAHATRSAHTRGTHQHRTHSYVHSRSSRAHIKPHWRHSNTSPPNVTSCSVHNIQLEEFIKCSKCAVLMCPSCNKKMCPACTKDYGSPHQDLKSKESPQHRTGPQHNRPIPPSIPFPPTQTVQPPFQVSTPPVVPVPQVPATPVPHKVPSVNVPSSSESTSKSTQSISHADTPPNSPMSPHSAEAGRSAHGELGSVPVHTTSCTTITSSKGEESMLSSSSRPVSSQNLRKSSFPESQNTSGDKQLTTAGAINTNVTNSGADTVKILGRKSSSRGRTRSRTRSRSRSRTRGRSASKNIPSSSKGHRSKSRTRSRGRSRERGKLSRRSRTRSRSKSNNTHGNNATKNRSKSKSSRSRSRTRSKSRSKRGTNGKTQAESGKVSKLPPDVPVTGDAITISSDNSIRGSKPGRREPNTVNEDLEDQAVKFGEQMFGTKVLSSPSAPLQTMEEENASMVSVYQPNSSPITATAEPISPSPSPSPHSLIPLPATLNAMPHPQLASQPQLQSQFPVKLSQIPPVPLPTATPVPQAQINSQTHIHSTQIPSQCPAMTEFQAISMSPPPIYLYLYVSRSVDPEPPHTVRATLGQNLGLTPPLSERLHFTPTISSATVSVSPRKCPNVTELGNTTVLSTTGLPSVVPSAVLVPVTPKVAPGIPITSPHMDDALNHPPSVHPLLPPANTNDVQDPQQSAPKKRRIETTLSAVRNPVECSAESSIALGSSSSSSVVATQPLPSLQVIPQAISGALPPCATSFPQQSTTVNQTANRKRSRSRGKVRPSTRTSRRTRNKYSSSRSRTRSRSSSWHHSHSRSRSRSRSKSSHHRTKAKNYSRSPSPRSGRATNARPGRMNRNERRGTHTSSVSNSHMDTKNPDQSTRNTQYGPLPGFQFSQIPPQNQPRAIPSQPPQFPGNFSGQQPLPAPQVYSLHPAPQQAQLMPATQPQSQQLQAYPQAQQMLLSQPQLPAQPHQQPQPQPPSHLQPQLSLLSQQNTQSQALTLTPSLRSQPQPQPLQQQQPQNQPLSLPHSTLPPQPPTQTPAQPQQAQPQTQPQSQPPPQLQPQPQPQLKQELQVQQEHEQKQKQQKDQQQLTVQHTPQTDQVQAQTQPKSTVFSPFQLTQPQTQPPATPTAQISSQVNQVPAVSPLRAQSTLTQSLAPSETSVSQQDTQPQVIGQAPEHTPQEKPNPHRYISTSVTSRKPSSPLVSSTPDGRRAERNIIITKTTENRTSPLLDNERYDMPVDRRRAPGEYSDQGMRWSAQQPFRHNANQWQQQQTVNVQQPQEYNNGWVSHVPVQHQSQAPRNQQWHKRTKSLHNAHSVQQQDQDYTEAQGVSINMLPCSIRSWNNTVIICVAPAGVGANLPLLVTYNGNNLVAPQSNFSYRPPIIWEASSAPTSGGSVYIWGSNIGSESTSVLVLINGKECTGATVVDYSTITCKAPEGTGRGLPITVEVPKASVYSQTTTTYAFWYEAPTLEYTSSAPTHGYSPIVIYGTNFGSGADGLVVTIQGQLCTSPIAYHTKITCYPPPGAGRCLTLSIDVNGQGCSRACFFYYDAPLIWSNDPPPTSGGPTTIYGQNLGTTNTSVQVYMGDYFCESPVVNRNGTEIRCIAPPGTGRLGWVFVMVPSDENYIQYASNWIFTYQAPTIDNITSADTDGKESFRIYGTNFGAKGSYVDVAISGQWCRLASVIVDDTVIEAWPPAEKPPAPSISAVTEASTNGHEITNITGKNLCASSRLVSVTIGGHSCVDVVAVSHYLVRCYPFPGVSGPHELILIGYQGSSYTGIINGVNFGPEDTIAKVKVGGLDCINATVTIAHTQIMCFLPPGEGDHVTVEVFVSDGVHGSTTSADVFEYNGMAIISASTVDATLYQSTSVLGTNFNFIGAISVVIDGYIACNNATLVNSTVVTCTPSIGYGKNLPICKINITGKNFGPSAKVLVNGIECNETRVEASTFITCVAPPGSGRVPLVVITPISDFHSQSVASYMCYNKPILLEATSVATDGREATFITGSNFGVNGTVDVTISGVACKEAKITVPHTQISCIPPPGVGTWKLLNVSTSSICSSSAAAAIFFYSCPVIISATNYGDFIVITGLNFGPFGTDVTITIYKGLCFNGTIETPHTRVRCIPDTVPEDRTSLTVRVADPITLNFCEVSKVVIFQGPLIQSTSTPPTDCNNSWLVINGENFGPNTTQVEVYIAEYSCMDASILEPYKRIKCRPPCGAGSELPLEVRINADGSHTYSVRANFSYDSPTVFDATPVPTSGGWTIITGENFGPINSTVSVWIGGRTCLNAEVVVNHTHIRCLVPAGTGANSTVFVTALSFNTGRPTTGKNTSVFSYLAPQITSATSVNTDNTHAVSTISGSNFGPIGTEVRVKIADQPWVGVSLPVQVIIISTTGGDSSFNSSNVFSYNIPTLSQATSINTYDLAATIITGTNFGPASLSHVEVWVGSQICAAASIIQDHTKIACYPPAGTGKQINVTLSISRVGSGKPVTVNKAIFSYTAPQIMLVTSTTTAVSGNITIYGTNFGPSAANGGVYVEIKGSECTSPVMKVPHFQIECTPPPGAGGNLPVIVYVPGKSVTNPVPQLAYGSFSYSAPEIFLVTEAATSGEESISITGANFGPNGTDATVTIDGVICSDVKVKNHTIIECLPPPGYGQGHRLVVHIPADESFSQSAQYLNFIYQAPQVFTATPSNTEGGYITTIKGKNFGDSTQVNISVTISLCNVPMACTNATTTIPHKEITCFSPPGTGTSNLVSVWVPAGTSQVGSSFVFDYNPPEITDVPLCSTSISSVFLSGKNFGPGASKGDSYAIMYILDNSTQLIYAAGYVNHTTLQIYIPDGSGANHTISVKVKDQMSNIFNYSYYGPEVSSASAVDTSGNQQTVISGKNMGPVGTELQVTINGQLCARPSVTEAHTTIACTPPVGAGANLTLNLSVGGQSSFWKYFSYNSPTVSYITLAPTSGLSPIQITGTNFGPNNTHLSVTIDEGSVPLTCQNPRVIEPHTTISCWPPVGVGALKTLRVSVWVDGSQPLSTFGVFSYLAPVIHSVTQSSTAGLDLITIVGDNFGPLGTNITVTVGENSCANASVIVNHTHITCLSPPGTGKELPICVYIANQIGCGSFSYFGPSITGATPTPTSGTFDTIINGTNFGTSNEISVYINGLPCINVAVSIPHLQISCTTPPGSGKNLTLELYIPSRASIYSQKTSSVFSYFAPIVVSATSTLTDGTTPTTIFGSNFGPNGGSLAVRIGGKECSNAQILDDSNIKCYPPPGVGKNNLVEVDIPATSRYMQSTSALVFSYYAPTFSSSTPIATDGSATLYIFGTGFGPQDTIVSVTINNETECSGPIVSSAHGVITCTPGAGVGRNKLITIFVPAKGMPSTQSVSGYFSYTEPTVISSTPANTDATSYTIITGTNFGPSGTTVGVTISGQQCTNATVAVPHTQIKCLPPPGVGANNTLKVIIPNPDGQVAYSQLFSYNGPVIHSIPTPPTSGNLTIISGANFGPGGMNYGIGYRIDNGSLISATWLSQTHLLIPFPASSGSFHTLQVVVRDLQSAVVSFSYAAPSIISATPATTDGLTQTIITGVNFGPLGTPVLVTIESQGVPVVCSNASVSVPHVQITCIPPQGTGQSHAVNLEVPLGTGAQFCSANVFSYSAPVVLSASSVSHSGGETTIRGANFGQNPSLVSVTINKKTCKSPTIKTAHTILTCQAPAGSGSSLDVVVLVDGLYSEEYPVFDYIQSGLSKGGIAGISVASICGAAALCAAAAAFLVFKRKKADAESEVSMNSLLPDNGASVAFEDTFNIPDSRNVILSDFILATSVSTLTFGLESRQAEVDQVLEETLTLHNATKKTVSFKFFAPRSYKYKIAFEPEAGVIDASYEQEITIKAIILCTTRVTSHVTLAANSGHDFAKGDVQHSKIDFHIESALSGKLDPEEISLSRPAIGEGSYGFVYKGDWRGQLVAVKILKCQESTTTAIREDFLKEVKIMESFRCPQIVNFVGAVYVPSKLAIVTEFMPFGSLATLLRTQRLTAVQKIKMMQDAARGMNFLHKSGILHRDLKLDNVLVSSLDPACAVCAKISDFGTTRTVQAEKDALQMTQGIGTPAYMSPEILRNSDYSSSSDVYSFGVLLYAVFTEQDPYSGAEFATAWKLAEFVISGKRMVIPSTVPKVVSDLMTTCWDQEPLARPSFADVVTILEQMKL